MALRRFQEGRAVALNVRTGLAPLLFLGVHSTLTSDGPAHPIKRRLPPYSFESKTEAASGQVAGSLAVARQGDARRPEQSIDVGTIIPFDDEGEAIRVANASDFALAATLWTTDLSRAHTVARRVRADAVAVIVVVSALGVDHPDSW
ncbi:MULTISPECIES: aldehyde dehydrogenase family protein [Streptomyces]|uniref:Aldehyde dehydrogenase family protein n=1 Tax=Streptomyces sp. 900129855 TaxID=3155129 RepID=A0ABV2ZI50_9ACTN